MNGNGENVYTMNCKTSLDDFALQNLNQLRLNKQLCDCLLVLDDGFAMNVHRNILSCSSSYFQALFTTCLHKNQWEFKLHGIQRHIMTIILNYIYVRDTSNITYDNVFELYVCADYLGIVGLILRCQECMSKNIIEANCVGIMLFARNRNDPELEQMSRFFILGNFVEVSVRSQELLQLSVDQFFSIVNDEILNVKDEQTVWECIIRWIDVNPEDRKQYLTKLMRGVRLGLLNNSYFMEHVKNHKYVEGLEEARPIIIETMTFLYDLEIVNPRSAEVLTPHIALPRLPHEVIFAIGGWSQGLPQKFMETYDTRADRWVRVMNEDPAGPRAYHGTAVIGSKIYLIGGFDGVEYFNTCRCFDCIKKEWKQISPMHDRRCYVAVTVLNGLIYALGGFDGTIRQNTAELYNPEDNQWSRIAPMHYQRSDGDACCFNGKVYAFGGFNGQECLNSVECYSPEKNEWFIQPQMLSRRSGVSCVTFADHIYVIGGFNGLSRMTSGERYDPVRKLWNNIKDMYHPRSNFGLEIIDDLIFAIGGFNGVVTISHTECYNPETDEWLEATDMSIIRSALTANVVKKLPNISEYLHKDRHRLMQERRLKMITGDFDGTFEMRDESDLDLVASDLDLERIENNDMEVDVNIEENVVDSEESEENA